ncbi:putative uncharacterized protein [Pseudomonas sp. StFLB209]|nr:putative uncharacterized protein [Pseudomonas sp. StFLB209]
MQMFQLLQAFDIFQTFEQALFLLAGQQQDALVGAGCAQLFTPTITGAGRAGMAKRARAHGCSILTRIQM